MSFHSFIIVTNKVLRDSFHYKITDINYSVEGIKYTVKVLFLDENKKVSELKYINNIYASLKKLAIDFKCFIKYRKGE